jgi:hypothetical protein
MLLLAEAIVANVNSAMATSKLVSEWLDCISPEDPREDKLGLKGSESTEQMNATATLSPSTDTSNTNNTNNTSVGESKSSTSSGSSEVGGIEEKASESDKATSNNLLESKSRVRSTNSVFASVKRHFLNGLEGTPIEQQNELRTDYFHLLEAVRQSIERVCKSSDNTLTANGLAVVFDLLSMVAIDYSSEDLPFLARSGIVEFLNDVVKVRVLRSIEAGVPGATGLCSKLSSLQRLLGTRCLTASWSDSAKDEKHSAELNSDRADVTSLRLEILNHAVSELRFWETTQSVFVMDTLTTIRDAHQGENG